MRPGSSDSGDATLVDLLGPAAGGDTIELSPPSTVLFGRYEVMGLLGTGGMGSVYRVNDLALEEVVALKILRRDERQAAEQAARFRQEVRLARRVNHENVVRTFDLGEAEGALFLTMELVPGRSLTRVLAEDGALQPARALAVAAPILAGIGAAHRAGVLHCDLKPDNVLLADDGRVVLTDFGIARAIGGRYGDAVGTPAYMAPEQVEGAQLTAAADLYAFGVLLFEMLTGRRPWTGASPQALAEARLHVPPPDPRLHAPVPDALAEVVNRCLARHPSDRFPSAEAVAAALAEVQITSLGLQPSLQLVSLPSPVAPSLAVLPLRASGEAVDRSLAEGLTEELIDALAGARALRVRPLASVLSLPRDADPIALGRQLDVRAVAEGSVRRKGDLLQIKIRLLGVEDGFQLWAGRFTCPPEEVLSEADSIAAALAGALAVKLPSTSRAAVPEPAMDRFLRARAMARAHWDDDLRAPIALYAEAAALAPEDAGISAAYASTLARQAMIAWVDGGGSDLLSRARVVAARAIALGPEQGETLLAMAHVHLYEGDFPSAAVALRSALARSPGLARAQEMLGNILLEVGLVEEGMDRLRAALALDPGAYRARIDLTRGLALAGQWEEVDALLALEPATEAERLARSIHINRLSGWAPGRRPIDDLAGVAEGRALSLARQVRDIYQWVAARGTLPRGFATADLGDLPSVHPLLRTVRAQASAEVCALVGERGLGLQLIEVAVAAQLHDLTWMSRCRALDPLRSHPDWAALESTVAARASRVREALRLATGAPVLGPREG